MKKISDKIFTAIMVVEAVVLSLLLTLVTLGVSFSDIQKQFSQIESKVPQIFIIRSGSMAGVMPKGSLIMSQPKADYSLGEVISFRRGTQIITHRIVNIDEQLGSIRYETQGDANPGPDRLLAEKENVIGAVFFIMPYAGYLVAFLKTRLGFNLFIFVPAGLIIFSELLNIFKEIKGLRGAKPAMVQSRANYRKVLFMALILLSLNPRSSNAIFSDTETSSAQIILEHGGKPPCDWDKSSLSFDEVCGCCQVDGNEISVWICNGEDSGNMQGSVDWEVYYIEKGNPKNGELVFASTLSPLLAGECELLTFDTEGEEGNYMFKAYQRPGHPGTGELWSQSCSISEVKQPEKPKLPEKPELPEPPSGPETPTLPDNCQLTNTCEIAE